mgnify:CR=1 FL=1
MKKPSAVANDIEMRKTHDEPVNISPGDLGGGN